MDTKPARPAIVLRALLFTLRLALVAGLVLILFPGLVPAGAAERMATPSTGTGPFYPVDDSRPMDNDLTRAPGAEGVADGTVLYVDGTVRDLEGRPIADAEVVLWQVDAGGNYNHPGEARSRIKAGGEGAVDYDFQHWGKTRTDADGRYRFKTIVPAHYRAQGITRPNHCHFLFRRAGYRTLATEMSFAGDPHFEDDFVTAGLSEAELALLAVEPRPADASTCWQACEPGAVAATFDVVLAAAP